MRIALDAAENKDAVIPGREQVRSAERPRAPE
jgi:hypothetical protein